ncbi:MAG: extracytoplasmic sigma factor ECF [Gemmatimonadota bacterium]|nr:MAG: extracytoplasmic sigma factor ECF [Gemmatimonadota bacterium]
MLLDEFATGERSGLADLLPLVYSELRALAAAHFKAERVGHTLQPTALVHNAYIRMVEQTTIRPTNRAHFFALASKLMRELLVDHARARSSQKRGGNWQRVTLSVLDSDANTDELDVLDLEDARQELMRLDPRKAAIVELRYYGGLTVDEISEALRISEVTVRREWRKAKAWLVKELAEGDGREP